LDYSSDFGLFILALVDSSSINNLYKRVRLFLYSTHIGTVPDTVVLFGRTFPVDYNVEEPGEFICSVLSLIQYNEEIFELEEISLIYDAGLGWFYPEIYDFEAECLFDFQLDLEDDIESGFESDLYRAVSSIASSGGIDNPDAVDALRHCNGGFLSYI
jgi:hypothetical protein